MSRQMKISSGLALVRHLLFVWLQQIQGCVPKHTMSRPGILFLLMHLFIYFIYLFI